jgi:hypothetical protein
VAIHRLHAPLPEHHLTGHLLDLILQIAGDELAFVKSYLSVDSRCERVIVLTMQGI